MAEDRQRTAMNGKHVVFTAGYEGRSLEEFIAALRHEGVTLLADVREAPISRKRGFSKSALAQALSQCDIDYQHHRALGCPKPIRDRHKEDGDWARYTRDFMEHLGSQQPALDALAAVVKSRPTALMCYEADFNRCHRTYVARAMAQRTGAMVRHITHSGAVEEESAP
jgi:uncharacterized protein (DUF488 family)